MTADLPLDEEVAICLPSAAYPQVDAAQERAWATQKPDPMEFVAFLMPRLARTCRSACRSAGDESLAQEAFSDVVVVRAHRVMELWNPAKMDLAKYFTLTMKWYVYKWACRQRKFVTGRVLRERTQVDMEMMPIDPETAQSDTRLELEGVLDKLDKYDQWLLETHVVLGYSFDEMAQARSISKGAVRVHFHKALELARKIARESQWWEK